MKSDNLAILYTCHQKECMVKVVPHISLSFSLSFSLSLCVAGLQSRAKPHINIYQKEVPKGGWPTLFSGSNPWSFKWVSALWSVFWVVCVFLQQDCGRCLLVENGKWRRPIFQERVRWVASDPGNPSFVGKSSDLFRVSLWFLGRFPFSFPWTLLLSFLGL